MVHTSFNACLNFRQVVSPKLLPLNASLIRTKPNIPSIPRSAFRSKEEVKMYIKLTKLQGVDVVIHHVKLGKIMISQGKLPVKTLKRSTQVPIRL